MKRPSGITVVAFLMILFGIAEIVTDFTLNFLGQHPRSRDLNTPDMTPATPRRLWKFRPELRAI
jgi:hypothetical protein